MYKGEFEYKRFNKSAIPKDSLTEYDYSMQTHLRLEKAPKMSELVPAGETIESYQDRVTAAAMSHFKLAA